LALTVIGVPWLLSFAQPTIWQLGRPWYLAWAGLVYIVAAVATLIWIAATGRSAERHAGVPATVQRHASVTPDEKGSSTA
jgi:alpha-1,2-mannosyltransferase